MKSFIAILTSLWKNTRIIVVALLGLLFPLLGTAGPMGLTGPLIDDNCLDLPLSMLLRAQGTSTAFFPPVRDYVGWTDRIPTTFALVDYAGLANDYIKTQPKSPSLSTQVRGSVKKCRLADSGGRSLITVDLSTTRALGFAQSIQALRQNQFDFLNTPTLFGAKAQDVINGVAAAVGPATLSTTFIIGPNESLPDLVDVLVNNSAKYAPVTLNFTSTTDGTCSNGNDAQLAIHEEAATNDKGQLIFSVERVEAIDTHGNSCGD